MGGPFSRSDFEDMPPEGASGEGGNSSGVADEDHGVVPGQLASVTRKDGGLSTPPPSSPAASPAPTNSEPAPEAPAVEGSTAATPAGIGFTPEAPAAAAKTLDKKTKSPNDETTTTAQTSQKTKTPAEIKWITSAKRANATDGEPSSQSKRQKINHQDDTETVMFEPSPILQQETSDTSGTPSKKGHQGKVKKGAYRTARNQEVEEPGDVKTRKAFISIESNEQKLSAYIGYLDTAHLKAFSMSWPVIKAYVLFDKIALNLGKRAALQLLYDNEAAFIDVDPHEKWPLGEEPSMAARSCHLAFILLQMERDVKRLGKATVEQNRQEHKKYAALFSKTFQNDVPNITYDADDTAGNTGAEVLLFHAPVLGPHAQETRVEVFNRLWNVLRYIRYCIQGKLWQQKFSTRGMQRHSSIDISHVPQWMRPQKDTIPQIRAVTPKTAEVTVADNLPPLKIEIVWEMVRFAGTEDLEEALQKAEAANITIPKRRQPLLSDPRLFSSIGAFRDAIRRQFNCQELLMNIRSLRLTYYHVDDNEVPDRRNVHYEPWDGTKLVLESATHSNFTFHVTFEVLDDADDLYEEIEPPPEVTALFDTSSGDVRINQAGVENIVASAFGNDAVEPAPPAAESTNPGESIQSFLDMPVNQDGSADGIGLALTH